MLTLDFRLLLIRSLHEPVAGDRIFPRAAARQVRTPEVRPLDSQDRKCDSFPHSSGNREKFRKNALLKVSMLDRQSLNQR